MTGLYFRYFISLYSKFFVFCFEYRTIERYVVEIYYELLRNVIFKLSLKIVYFCFISSGNIFNQIPQFLHLLRNKIYPISPHLNWLIVQYFLQKHIILKQRSSMSLMKNLQSFIIHKALSDKQKTSPASSTPPITPNAAVLTARLPIDILLILAEPKSSITLLVLPNHGQVFFLGIEYLLQAFRLKIVYTL